MKSKNKKMSKTTIIIIIAIMSTLILAAVFFGTFYFFTDKSLNQYEKSMRQAINSINTINKSTNSFLNENVINTEASKTGLPEIISELEKIKTKISILVPGDKFKIQHAVMQDGLNNNILMYRQILNVLQSPNSTDLNAAVIDYTNYRDDCANYYAQCYLSGSSISLSKEAENFLKGFEYYSNELIKIQRDADIRSSQTLDFITKLDTISSNFLPLKTDFSVEMSKARGKEITYDDVIKLATEYQSKSNSLEKELHSISVPQNCKTLKNEFSKIFDDYDLYIQSFTLGLVQEKNESVAQTATSQEPGTQDPNEVKTQTPSLDEESLKDIYYDTNNRYLAMQDKYDNFSRQFTEFKNSNVK